MRVHRRAMPLGLACLIALAPYAACQAAATATIMAPTMEVTVNGRVPPSLTPGMRIGVTVRALPPARHAYCLGLASAVDRYSLPVSLGRVTRDPAGVGRVAATIPPRLFPAEPAGPFLFFVGTCTPIAPDRPFLARTIITIVPSHTAAS